MNTTGNGPVAKKGMKFRCEIQDQTNPREDRRFTWCYQQDSRTQAGAEKVASQMRHLGFEARVIAL